MLLQAFILVSMILIVPVSSSTPQFTAGASWTLDGKYQFTAASIADYTDYYSESGHFVQNYTVTDANSVELHISSIYTGTWSCSATKNWKSDCTKTGDQQSSSTSDWTISLPGVRVTATTASEKWIGHYPWFLVDVTGLRDDGTVKRVWWVPTSDNKDNTLTDVDWKVGTQAFTENGRSVTAWTVTHTGQALGWYHHDKVYSHGPETDQVLFDPVLGTIIGATYNQTAVQVQGGWRETYFQSMTLADTTLSTAQAISITFLASDVTRLVFKAI